MVEDLIVTAAESLSSGEGIILLSLCLGVAWGLAFVRGRWGVLSALQSLAIVALLCIASVWAYVAPGFPFLIAALLLLAVAALALPALAIASARWRAVAATLVAVVVAGTLPTVLFVASCVGALRCD